MKYSLLSLAIVTIFLAPSVVAAEDVVVDATLNSESPISRTITQGASLVDLATLDITAVSGNIYLRGFVLGADTVDGLKNFVNIVIYDAATRYPVGEYPSRSSQVTRIEITPVTITAPRTKTYIIRGTPTSSAAGVVRVGFQSLILGNDGLVSQTHMPIYGNAMTLPGTVATPSVMPTPSSSPIQPPIFTGLAQWGLREGDIVGASDSSDPDIYIVNAWGYKRLFLNPVIFGFYGHLGGFGGIKRVMPSVQALLGVSGLFRNCETNDQKVYGLEVVGEDGGVLHWVNTTGAQAIQDDPHFFEKVFCINSREFQWYAQGAEYTSVTQIPSYSR